VGDVPGTLPLALDAAARAAHRHLARAPLGLRTRAGVARLGALVRARGQRLTARQRAAQQRKGLVRALDDQHLVNTDTRQGRSGAKFQ
jgi:hypothetical protein